MHRSTNDLTGLKFGKLTVVGLYGRSKNKQLLWDCICDCGNKTIVLGRNISTGRTTSCGCYRKEKNSKPPGESYLNHLYRHYKIAAKRRNHTFSLSKEEFSKLILSNCHYCGIIPSNDKQIDKARNFVSMFSYNGIDRINNSKGYELGNVVPCCKTCNLGKHTQTYEEFIEYLERVKNYRFDLASEQLRVK
jgi:hypothetical protein